MSRRRGPRRAMVIGSGPNGLSAASQLIRAGWDVTVHEAASYIGGAATSVELFGPGFFSDTGATVLPLAVKSPASSHLRHAEVSADEPFTADSAEADLHWMHPPVALAHARDDADAAVLYRSLSDTAHHLGADGPRWKALFAATSGRWDSAQKAAVEPVNRQFQELLAGSESRMGRLTGLLTLGTAGALPAAALQRLFTTDGARDLLTGITAHSTGPLTTPLSSAAGLLLAAAAHQVGWPVLRGGTRALADALAADITAHGGEIRTNSPVRQLPRITARGTNPGSSSEFNAVIADITPAQLLALGAGRLSPKRRRRLQRWDYGPGIVKIDYLLDAPVPWSDPLLAQAGTVHLGGSARQIIASEGAANRGVVPGRPFTLVAQPQVADSTRSPDHRQLIWAYAHIPAGLAGELRQCGELRQAGASRVAAMDDVVGSDSPTGSRYTPGSPLHRVVRGIEAEISRYAPEFAQVIERRYVHSPQLLQAQNPNLVGGSLSAGIPSMSQALAGPMGIWNPYSSGIDGLYVCSASTPPGGGAHGMSGYNAAQAVLRERG